MPLLLLASTLLLSFVVAVVPAFPVEPLVVGVAAANPGWVPAVGAAAGLGQTLGKLLVFLATRGAINSPWVQRFTSRWSKPPASALGRVVQRAVARMDQPPAAAGVLFLSAAVGFPPLAIVTFYAARTRMTWPLFLLVTLVGRTVWFTVIALVPGLVTG